MQDRSNQGRQGGGGSRQQGNRGRGSSNRNQSQYSLPKDVIEKGGNDLVNAAETLGKQLKNRGLKNDTS